MFKLNESDVTALETFRRNADMLVEISAWAAGYRDCGFEAKSAMENIVSALEREGYMTKKSDKKKSKQ